MTEYLYRAFGSVSYSERVFEDDFPEVTIMIDALPILRRTPKGAWIKNPITDQEKWVSDSTRKRFAYPSEEYALESLRQRNRRHLGHLRAKIKKAEAIRDSLGGEFKIQRLMNGFITFSAS